jgi:hypothetical protein
MRKLSHEIEKLHLKICIVGFNHAHVCWYVFFLCVGVEWCVRARACACMCMHVHACACMCMHVHACACCVCNVLHAYKHKRNEPQRERQFAALTMQIILMELASVTLPDAACGMGFNVTGSEET